MTDDDRKELRDYAWKYFALHAGQRLTTLNFYLILVTLILGGLLAFLKDAKSPALACPAGVLLFVLSYVFWRLDTRNRELVNLSQEVLKATEKDIPAERVPENLRLFTREEIETHKRKKPDDPRWYKPSEPPWRNPLSWVLGHWTYRHALNCVFGSGAVLGLAIAIGVWLLPSAQPQPAPMPPTQNFYIGGQPVSPAATNKP